MTKATDNFEAARIIVATVKELDPNDQQMVFRWAAESLGLSLHTNESAAAVTPTPPSPSTTIVNPPPSRGAQDIKSFVEAKKPRSDMQFATAVAYWYQFVAPEPERKKSITEDDLLEACRKADRERPKKPYFTLNNAFNAGLLDRPKKGEFSVNAVGENLVAMTLPGDGSVKAKPAKKEKKKSKSGKRIPKKPATKRRAKA